MLRSARNVLGYSIQAADEDIGHCVDFLFDDDHWTIRYMVVDTGRWLSGRRVLVSPAALGQPVWEEERFPVRLTREQIEGAPPLEAHAPVSMRYERQYAVYYGYPFYWGGPEPWGVHPDPQSFALESAKERADPDLTPSERHLRSLEEVRGYAVRAEDEKVGTVDDLLIDDTTWCIHLVVVDMGGWLRRDPVLVAPRWFDRVDWGEGACHVDLPASAIREAPKFDPSLPMNAELEVQLYDFHGRPRP